MSINRIVYEESCCCYNAYVNQRNAYKELNLKWVIGSCAYNGFWEYGGPDYNSFEDFKNGDFHCWLEDKEGRVYDYFTARDDFCARINTGKSLKVRGLVEGRSKEEMESLGITYLAAPEKIRLQAFLHHLPMMKNAERIVLMGGSYRPYGEEVDDSIYDKIPTELGKLLGEKGIFTTSPKGKQSVAITA